MPNGNPSRKRQCAFTLIELLVVLGILGVLAALLLAAFTRVRHNAQRTTCASNLKQIALAMQQYTADNGGYYPLNFVNPDFVGTNLAAANPAKYFTTTWTYEILPYLTSGDVFDCPTAVGSGQTPGFLLSGGWSYGYNWGRLTYIAPPIPPPVPATSQRPRHESSIVSPSTIWLCEDEWRGEADGTYVFARELHASCGSIGGGTVHDGHVKWLLPEKFAEIECSNPRSTWPYP